MKKLKHSPRRRAVIAARRPYAATCPPTPAAASCSLPAIASPTHIAGLPPRACLELPAAASRAHIAGCPPIRSSRARRSLPTAACRRPLQLASRRQPNTHCRPLATILPPTRRSSPNAARRKLVAARRAHVLFFSFFPLSPLFQPCLSWSSAKGRSVHIQSVFNLKKRLGGLWYEE